MPLRKKRYNREPFMEINMTNLIDIVMVLLIVFILVSNFVQTGMGIQIPEVRYVETIGKPRIIVGLNAAGSITVNSEPVAKENLADKLKAVKEEFPEEAVFVQADESGIIGDLMTVVSAAGDAGFKQINVPLRLMNPAKN